MNTLKIAAIVAMLVTPAYADIYIRPHMKKRHPFTVLSVVGNGEETHA